MAKKDKRFWLNVIEYGVMNPKFYGFRVGRIEVFDSKLNSPYPAYEGSFCLPEEVGYKFRELIDFKHFDKPLSIHLDMFDKRYFPDVHKKYYGD